MHGGRGNIRFWQINIMFDTQQTIPVTVPENCYTGELFRKLNEHPRAPKTDDFELYSIGGSIRAELPRDNRLRLSDFDVTDRSTVSMVMRLPGGVLPTLQQLEQQPRILKRDRDIKITTSKDHPDVVGLDDENPRAIMPCGHAIAPLSLAKHCFYELGLEKGEYEIRCPVSNCKRKWDFALIRVAACLSPNEITEFEAQLHKNYFRKHSEETKACPKCGTFGHRQRTTDKRLICQNCTCTLRTGKKYEFCWTCLKEWTNLGVVTCGNPDCGENKEFYEILATCEMKEIGGAGVRGPPISCPSRRACPACSVIIEHKEFCKHMTCAHCKYEFCFICLGHYPCKADFEWSNCEVAPRQTSATKFLGMN